MAAKPRMNIIVAVDSNFGIGKNNTLPWHLPNEYGHFIKQTTQTVGGQNRINAVVMGRRCWESIPLKFRPLKGRINVILSRTMVPSISEQVVVARELDEALRILTEVEPFKDRIETIWNVGGKDIYELGLKHPWLHKLVITRLDKDFNCDVHFPKVDWDEFVLSDEFAQEEKCEENGVCWHVTAYKRKTF